MFKDFTLTLLFYFRSYGILLWEIATLGELPYQGYSNEEAGEYIKSGRILPKREGTPENL